MATRSNTTVLSNNFIILYLITFNIKYLGTLRGDLLLLVGRVVYHPAPLPGDVHGDGLPPDLAVEVLELAARSPPPASSAVVG